MPRRRRRPSGLQKALPANTGTRIHSLAHTYLRKSEGLLSCLIIFIWILNLNYKWIFRVPFKLRFRCTLAPGDTNTHTHSEGVWARSLKLFVLAYYFYVVLTGRRRETLLFLDGYASTHPSWLIKLARASGRLRAWKLTQQQ